MAELIFDAPWWLPTLLAGTGVVLFWTGNRRQEARVRNAGLGFLAATVAVAALSYFVQTDLEKCVTNSKRLVYAVEQRDWTTVNAILSPGVSLAMNDLELYTNRKQLVDAAQQAVDRYGIKNVRILSSSAERTETLITVTLTLASEQDFTQGRPITTNWKFEWQRSGNAWAMERMTCLKIANLTGENAARQFPQPR